MQIDVSCSDYVRSLGKGSFSTVSLVRCRRTSQLVALKKVELEQLEDEMKKQLLAELELLQLLQEGSAFLVRLDGFLLTQHQLHLQLEPCLGGDLWTQLHIRQTGFPDKVRYNHTTHNQKPINPS